MLELLLVNHLWLAIATWALMYVLDYTFTLKAARLYQNKVKEFISFGGSYELTPYYQPDINALRIISPRFLWALLVGVTLIFVSWAIAVHFLNMPDFFSFMLGMLILLQVAVHLRHIRNLALFRAIEQGESVTGRLEYSRFMTLKMSAVEFWSIAALFLLVFLLTSSWFFLGGAASCLGVGLKHRRWASAAAKEKLKPEVQLPTQDKV